MIINIDLPKWRNNALEKKEINVKPVSVKTFDNLSKLFRMS